MIKELLNLIGRKYVSVHNLKLCLLINKPFPNLFAVAVSMS